MDGLESHWLPHADSDGFINSIKALRLGACRSTRTHPTNRPANVFGTLLCPALYKSSSHLVTWSFLLVRWVRFFINLNQPNYWEVSNKFSFFFKPYIRRVCLRLSFFCCCCYYNQTGYTWQAGCCYARSSIGPAQQQQEGLSLSSLSIFHRLDLSWYSDRERKNL